MRIFFLLLFILCLERVLAQQDMLTYAGNAGNETFYDVMQLSDGSFLVVGAASNLDWIPSEVPRTLLGNTNGIYNSLGTNQFGILLHFSADLQMMLDLVYFPQGRVENVRFIKTDTEPYMPTGHLYISGTTNDTRANGGGYFIGKLNHNFIDQAPDSLVWAVNNWAEGLPKETQPWDVAPNGAVYCVQGQNHAYDWGVMYCLDGNSGKRKVVENWRTHWLKAGGEWRGAPASAAPGGKGALDYSGIVFKAWGRCDLRSWSQTDFQLVQPDENGGVKIGRWPLDAFFASPCDPLNPSNNGPGYSGYSVASCCPVYGASSVAVDRRSGDVYLGMNVKTVTTNGTPDFEPALIAFDSSGALRWWSRLYHEITPAGDTVNSLPDQYIDAIGIDYAHNEVVVGARCHGNNTENFWEGDHIAANPGAFGFQNRFTGSNGNIHISWLGKLALSNGILHHSTYMAEYAEGTGGLGAPFSDPLLAGWPNPNSGWPNVNTTRMAKNNLKVNSNGSVAVIAQGRRTITTHNAYQQMVLPAYNGKSCWNAFVRMYNPELNQLAYSGLVVGQWDTLTQDGGGNTELYGLFKTQKGLICVGKHTAGSNNIPIGNAIPVTQVPGWGKSVPEGESAILAWFQAETLDLAGDNPIVAPAINPKKREVGVSIFPNPSNSSCTVQIEDNLNNNWVWRLFSVSGQTAASGSCLNKFCLKTECLPPGVYVLELRSGQYLVHKKLQIQH